MASDARGLVVPALPAGDGAASGCRIGELFKLLSKSHVLELLHVFLHVGGPLRFVDLQVRLGMSPNTLSDRLKALVEAGLLTRTPYNQIPPRVDYAATAKAHDLRAAFAALDGWAASHDLAVAHPRPVPAPPVAVPAALR